LDAILIVKPETLIRWHQRAVRDTGRRTELAAIWAFPGIEGDFLTAG